MKKLLITFLYTFLVFSALLIWNEEAYAQETDSYAYAVLSRNGDLVFFRSTEIYAEGSQPVKDIDGREYSGFVVVDLEEAGDQGISWESKIDKTEIKRVFVSEGETIAPKNMRNWFSNCTNLTEFDAAGFDTSTVTDMSNMFYRCTSLKTLDLKGFDTGNVTNMSGMFWGCTELTALDVSRFDTSSVVRMDGMFSECRCLTFLDLDSFDTSKVSEMGGMFEQCSSLESLDLGGFDTRNVNSMNLMFCECSSLKALDLSGFDTSSVDVMSSMFAYCNSLASLDLSSFDTSSLIDMSYMFRDCSKLKSIDLSSFNTSNVLGMDQVFSGCCSLAALDLHNFNTGNVVEMFGMFYGCSSLESLDLSGFDTGNVDTMNDLFDGCSSLTALDLSSFNTENVHRMSGMFADCDKLQQISLGPGFVKWVESAYLPQGDWINESSGLKKTRIELYNDYPSHSYEWAGVWRRLAQTAYTEAENYGSGIRVRWDAATGASGYVIYRRAIRSGESAWTTFARWSNTTELSFVDTKVYEGTKYQYGIKAYYGDDPQTTVKLGPVGPMTTAVLYSKKPEATAKTTTSNTDSGIQISWSSVKGAVGYVIYRRAWSSTTNGWTEFQRWNNTTSTKWTDTSVYAGTRYQYGIKAYYGDDPRNMTYVGSVGPLSTNVRITTRKITSFTANESKATVKWDASSLFTGYQIQFAGDAAFSDKKTITVSDPGTTTVTFEYDGGKECFVRVRSYHLFNGVTYYGSWSKVLGFGFDKRTGKPITVC